MVGAVPGTPGTAPTFWVIGWNNTGNGLAKSVVGSGVEYGLPYIDLNVSGTPTSSSEGLYSIADTQVTASVGQTWNGSWFARLVSGTLTASPFIYIIEADGGTTEASSGASLALTSSLQRFSFNYTLTNSASNNLRCGFQIYVAQNVAVNATVRLYAPQLEQAYFSGTPILTSGSAVTRAGDVVAVTGAGLTAAINAKAGRSVTNLGFGPLSGGGEVWLFTNSPFQNVQFTSTTTIGTVSQAGTSANVVIGNSGSYGGVVKAAAGFDAASITMIANGGARASNAVAWGIPGGSLCLGSNNGSNHYLNAYLVRLTFGATKGKFDVNTASGGLA
jgi:hypothetical protein